MSKHLWTLAGVLFLTSLSQSAAQEVKEPASFQGHTVPVDCAALSPDGKILATGGRDTRGVELKLWDTATGREVASLEGNSESVHALAFSPDGSLLVSGDSEGRIRLWDVTARKLRATFRGPSLGTGTLVFSRDGKRLVSAGYKQVRLWDVASGEQLGSFALSVDARSLAVSPDSQTLAASNYQEIDLWNVPAGKLRTILSEHRGSVGRLAFTADGKTLVASSQRTLDDRQWRTQIKLWDPAAGRERATLPEQSGMVLDLVVSPDGKSLAVVVWTEFRGDNELRLVDAATGKVSVLHKVPHPRYHFVVFTPDGKLRVCGRADKTVKLWEVSLPAAMAR